MIRAYIGVKIIEAAKIEAIAGPADDGKYALQHESGHIYVSTAYIEKHQPEVGGYWVRYPDGYQSYSPASAFEGAYRPVTVGEGTIVTRANWR